MIKTVIVLTSEVEVNLGDSVELAPFNETDDPYCVVAKKEGAVIGFLPNLGTTCQKCFSGVPRKQQFCPNCGGDELVPYGPAYQIRAKGFDNYVCVVEEFIPDRKVVKIHIRHYE